MFSKPVLIFVGRGVFSVEAAQPPMTLKKTGLETSKPAFLYQLPAKRILRCRRSSPVDRRTPGAR